MKNSLGRRYLKREMIIVTIPQETVFVVIVIVVAALCSPVCNWGICFVDGEF